MFPKYLILPLVGILCFACGAKQELRPRILTLSEIQSLKELKELHIIFAFSKKEWEGATKDIVASDSAVTAAGVLIAHQMPGGHYVVMPGGPSHIVPNYELVESGVIVRWMQCRDDRMPVEIPGVEWGCEGIRDPGYPDIERPEPANPCYLQMTVNDAGDLQIQCAGECLIGQECGLGFYTQEMGGVGVITYGCNCVLN